MDIKKNDVVQIKPGFRGAGAEVIVDIVKDWGIKGHVIVPGRGRADFILKNDEFKRIGRAIYGLHEEETKKDEIENLANKPDEEGNMHTCKTNPNDICVKCICK